MKYFAIRKHLRAKKKAGTVAQTDGSVQGLFAATKRWWYGRFCADSDAKKNASHWYDGGERLPRRQTPWSSPAQGLFLFLFRVKPARWKAPRVGLGFSPPKAVDSGLDSLLDLFFFVSYLCCLLSLIFWRCCFKTWILQLAMKCFKHSEVWARWGCALRKKTGFDRVLFFHFSFAQYKIKSKSETLPAFTHLFGFYQIKNQFPLPRSGSSNTTEKSKRLNRLVTPVPHSKRSRAPKPMPVPPRNVAFWLAFQPIWSLALPSPWEQSRGIICKSKSSISTLSRPNCQPIRWSCYFGATQIKINDRQHVWTQKIYLDKDKRHKVHKYILVNLIKVLHKEDLETID